MNLALGTSAVKRYRPLIANESLLLLKRILADPQDYMGYVRRCVRAARPAPQCTLIEIG